MKSNKTDYTTLIPPHWASFAEVFTALGDVHRQRIVLMFDPHERLNVGDIVAVSTLTRSSVSHHLKILRQAKILHHEKIGKEVWFWINYEFMDETLSAVLDYVRESATKKVKEKASHPKKTVRLINKS
jgi:DNA-binding transcriptional ArsR family regulator